MWKELNTTPSVADEQFAPTGVVQLPNGQILSAFDISFVSPENHTLAIAASRVVGSGSTFGTVIIVNTNTNAVTKEIGSNGAFVGDCTTPPTRNTFSGPNGVIIVEKGGHADVWAADGPVFNTSCVPGSGLKTPSTVKVFDLHTGNLKAVIQTGNGKPGTVGQRRADELCYNPVSDVVLVANDDPLDNFIAFIGEDSLKVLQRIKFDGTDPNGAHILANGIEQCVFDPRDGKFWLNIPNTGASTLATPLPGVVLRISGEAPFHVEQVFDFSKAPLASTGCGGAAGMAVGPDHQIGLACGGANALIIDDRNGNPVSGGVLAGEGGADEMWFNPGDNQRHRLHRHLHCSTRSGRPPRGALKDACHAELVNQEAGANPGLFRFRGSSDSYRPRGREHHIALSSSMTHTPTVWVAADDEHVCSEIAWPDTATGRSGLTNVPEPICAAGRP